MNSTTRDAMLRGGTVLAGLGLAATLAGCGSATEPPEGCEGIVPASHLVVVVGVHRNAPAPQLHQAVRCDILSTLDAGGPVSVVALDGDPHLVVTAQVPPGAGSAVAHRDDVARAEAALAAAAASSATATSDGSDLFAAVGIAADQAASTGAPDATIVVLDSALPDRGAVNMTVPGMLGAAPAEVADRATATGDLPALAGYHVILVGAGYTTPPQEPLSPGQRADATGIITAVLERAGATVTSIPAPRTGEPPNTPFTTATVLLPVRQELPLEGTAVFDDASPLGFHPDSTNLRDQDAAAGVLAGLAAWLRADPARWAVVQGTCASAGTVEGRAALSKARADQIKDRLAALGADPDRIESEGLGYIANPEDRTPDGQLDPAAAARNRAVIITTGQG